MFVTLFVDIELMRVIDLVERVKITENLADFLLLKLLPAIVFAGFCLATVCGRKYHVIDELRYTWAIRII